MDLDDYVDAKVGVAVLVTAAVASPPIRKAVRKGAVYGLAGLLMAGDKLSSLAGNARRAIRRTGEDAAHAANEPAPAQAT